MTSAIQEFKTIAIQEFKTIWLYDLYVVRLDALPHCALTNTVLFQNCCLILACPPTSVISCSSILRVYRWVVMVPYFFLQCFQVDFLQQTKLESLSQRSLAITSNFCFRPCYLTSVSQEVPAMVLYL